MKTIYNSSGYIAEPRGAVGYLGKKITKPPKWTGYFLRNAHPKRFLDTVEPALNITLPIPIR
jgi:threonine synthase